MGNLKNLPNSEKKEWPWNEEVDESIYKVYDSWPKITIVTPSYNQGAFIEETIRSIVLQNYPNLEYIVMDGGSSDETIQVLDRYKPWIDICVSEKDKGQSDALIKGFDKASGDFMNWINSDDILCKNALFEIGKSIIENPGVAFIHGRNGIMNIDSELFSFMPHPDDMLDVRYICEMPYGQQACFFSRELYKECGGINRDLRFSMDYELYLRMHLLGRKVLRIDGHIGNIRIHDNTKTAQLETIMHLENGNAFMTFLENAGEKKKAQFLKSIGHTSYDNYKINIGTDSEFIRKAYLMYLKKNIWFYYNTYERKTAAGMAKEIIRHEFKNILNKDYLKIIKDGF